MFPPTHPDTLPNILSCRLAGLRSGCCFISAISRRGLFSFPQRAPPRSAVTQPSSSFTRPDLHLPLPDSGVLSERRPFRVSFTQPLRQAGSSRQRQDRKEETRADWNIRCVQNISDGRMRRVVVFHWCLFWTKNAILGVEKVQWRK